jgi:UDPglucose--hexose-1-phosphate uridylyltransferase
MPELRHDPLSGRPVIVVTERAARPYTVAPAPPEADVSEADCPFCPGNESMTPPESARLGGGAPGEPGWTVRVVPNLYPIVPVHEVVILSPDHRASFGRLDDDHAVDVVRLLRDRAALHLEQGCAHVQVLVNHRRAAGASIAHPHAQIVGLEAPPPEPLQAIARFDAGGGDLVAREIAAARDAALVVVDGPAPAWSPPAATAPFAQRVAHRSTRARFDEATDAEVAVVARATRAAVAKLGVTLDDPPYNLMFHTAPRDVRAGEFHWYVDIVPRTSVIAGFEMGTGILVNTVAPDVAADQLRSAPS